MTNARSAGSSLFGAVSTVATSVSSTFGLVTDGISIASKFIADAKEAQELRSIANLDDLEERLIDESAMSRAQRKAEVEAFMAKSTVHEHHFQTAHARLTKLFEDRKSAKSPKK